ncbi:MAG: hypothetical protein AAF699_12335 [Pseudomonadota bacterium]
MDSRTGSEMSPNEFVKILRTCNGGMAIYVHLPFCTTPGVVCTEHSRLAQDESEMNHYLINLKREMGRVTLLLDSKPVLTQLHLGGGTPNYLSEPQLMRLMDTIEAYFEISAATEMSLDASARRSSRTQLELLHGLGFRNISYKANDLSASIEQTFSRLDSFEILQDVFSNTREAGLKTISMDLAYGLPEQSIADITDRLQQIKILSPDRVSCHSYTAKAETFGHHNLAGQDAIPSLADRLVMFNTIAEFMQAEGYEWVGLDYFAKSTDTIAEAHQQQRLHRNVIGYNTHGCPNTLGFGTRAVSDIGSRAITKNHNSIQSWHAALQRAEFPMQSGILLSEDEASQRRAMQDLLCNLQVDDYTQLAYDETSASRVRELEAAGVLQITDDKAVVTEQGRFALHHTVIEHSLLTPWRLAV